MYGRSLNRVARADNENVTKGALPMMNGRIFVTKHARAERDVSRLSEGRF
jgi:hypothetical protein